MRVIYIIFTILQSIIAFECTNELATYTISLPSSLMIYKVSHFDASVIGVSVDNSPCASLSRGIYDCQGVVSSTIELNTSMPVWDDVLQSSMFMEAYPTPPSPPLQPPPSPPPNIELYVADPDVEDNSEEEPPDLSEESEPETVDYRDDEDEDESDRRSG